MVRRTVRLAAGTMFMAVVTATLFLRTNLHPTSVSEGNLYFSVLFFSLIMLMHALSACHQCGKDSLFLLGREVLLQCLGSEAA